MDGPRSDQVQVCLARQSTATLTNAHSHPPLCTLRPCRYAIVRRDPLKDSRTSLPAWQRPHGICVPGDVRRGRRRAIIRRAAGSTRHSERARAVLPGLSIVLGLPLILLSLQLVVAAKKPWLPNRLARLEIRRTDLDVLVEKTGPHLRRLERGLKPRLLILTATIGPRSHSVAACFVLSIFRVSANSVCESLPLWGLCCSAFAISGTRWTARHVWRCGHRRVPRSLRSVAFAFAAAAGLASVNSAREALRRWSWLRMLRNPLHGAVVSSRIRRWRMRCTTHIDAPPSTETRRRRAIPNEAGQEERAEWRFGMKAHVGNEPQRPGHGRATPSGWSSSCGGASKVRYRDMMSCNSESCPRGRVT